MAQNRLDIGEDDFPLLHHTGDGNQRNLALREGIQRVYGLVRRCVRSQLQDYLRMFGGLVKDFCDVKALLLHLF